MNLSYRQIVILADEIYYFSPPAVCISPSSTVNAGQQGLSSQAKYQLNFSMFYDSTVWNLQQQCLMSIAVEIAYNLGGFCSTPLANNSKRCYPFLVLGFFIWQHMLSWGIGLHYRACSFHGDARQVAEWDLNAALCGNEGSMWRTEPLCGHLGFHVDSKFCVDSQGSVQKVGSQNEGSGKNWWSISRPQRQGLRKWQCYFVRGPGRVPRVGGRMQSLDWLRLMDRRAKPGWPEWAKVLRCYSWTFSFAARIQ